MKNTIENNLQSWNDTYHRSQDGDEWQGQAKYCGITYEKWKDFLTANLLSPYLGKSSSVLEIAKKRMYWSESLMIA